MKCDFGSCYLSPCRAAVAALRVALGLAFPASIGGSPVQPAYTAVADAEDGAERLMRSSELALVQPLKGGRAVLVLYSRGAVCQVKLPSEVLKALPQPASDALPENACLTEPVAVKNLPTTIAYAVPEEALPDQVKRRIPSVDEAAKPASVAVLEGLASGLSWLGSQIAGGLQALAAGVAALAAGGAVTSVPADPSAYAPAVLAVLASQLGGLKTGVRRILEDACARAALAVMLS